MPGRDGVRGTVLGTAPSRRCVQSRRGALGRYAIRGMIKIATMFATLIIGLIAGPAVSL